MSTDLCCFKVPVDSECTSVATAVLESTINNFTQSSEYYSNTEKLAYQTHSYIAHYKHWWCIYIRSVLLEFHHV